MEASEKSEEPLRAKLVRGWVAQRPTRIELHFLPGYSPELNPVECPDNNDVEANAADLGRARVGGGVDR